MFTTNAAHRPYDIITISTTVKSLPTIEPLAKALPLMLKPDGKYGYLNPAPTTFVLTLAESL